MPVALRSFYSASVALVGAGAIAVSPLSPAPDAHLPNVQSPAIELLAAPAAGANLYQILVNQFGNFLASAPIVIGSTEQCTVCLGPAAGLDPIPFTGWGAIGIGAGLLNSVPTFIDGLTSGDGFLSALGQAGMAVQTPISNTFILLNAPRGSFGGFGLNETLGRALTSLNLALNNLYHTAVGFLITAPLTIAGGVVIGLQTFASTLAVTGDFQTAFDEGLSDIQTQVGLVSNALVTLIQDNRTNLYNSLGSGPGATAHPIPTYDSGSGAAPAAAASVKAAPEAAETSEAPALPSGGPKPAAKSVKTAPETGSGSDANGAGSGAGAGHASSDSTDQAKGGDSRSARHSAGGAKRAKAGSGD